MINLGLCDKCLKMTTNIKYSKFVCLVLKPRWCLFARDCPFYWRLYLNGVPNWQRVFVVVKYILIESKTESFLEGNSIPQFFTIIVAALNIGPLNCWFESFLSRTFFRTFFVIYTDFFSKDHLDFSICNMYLQHGHFYTNEILQHSIEIQKKIKSPT